MKKLTSVLFWIWENSDKLSKWAQIITFLFAGLWAYSRFNEAERPALEFRASTDSSLQLDYTGKLRTDSIAFNGRFPKIVEKI